MQKITILCVGKLKEKFYTEAVAEYAKRLSRYCKLEITELPEERLPEDPSPPRSPQLWRKRPPQFGPSCPTPLCCSLMRGGNASLQRGPG